MGDPAAGEEIDAGCGNESRHFERYPARGFRDGPTIDQAHRFGEHFGGHIIEQDRIDSGIDGLAQLGQSIDLAFDLDQMADMAPRRSYRLFHPAGDGDMIVLDENRVVEAEAVIETAAAAHRVFFLDPQAGRRLARAANLGFRP